MGDLRTQLQSSLGDAYTIERELAGGGFARVFLARDVALDRRVVIKVRSPDLACAVRITDRLADLPPLLAFADSLRRQVSNARQVVIKDGGHGAHFAQPQQFNSALLVFFASISTVRPQ
ncbi:MAG: hypothetical protein ACREOG_19960 [Gemmatimonadaceae bacterium]